CLWPSAVWSASPTEVFLGVAVGTILHYDGQDCTWGDGKLRAYNLWGLSGNDIYAADMYASGLYHYNGSVWEDVLAGVDDVTQNAGVFALWGFSTNDVYLSVEPFQSGQCGGKHGLVAHYNGTAFESISPLDDVWSCTAPRALWGTSSKSLFAGFSDSVQYYDGNEWRAMETDGPIAVKKLWGFADNDVFAVGGTGSSDIWRCTP
ncbi:MAG: hypothetical protein GY854_11040, partial [Deltaproteobacteria bacterium]|nr:hypothetical protein [Deltaproteobacteria bacterium]